MATQRDYLEERFNDLKEDLGEIKSRIRSIENGYVSTANLELIIGPLVQRVEKLEATNLRISRIVGGIIITALLGLIIVQGGLTG